MTGVRNCAYSKCVSVAIPLPKHLIRDLQTAAAGEYNDTYFALNRKLNEFVLLGERTLRDAGYDAYAQNTDRVVVDESHRSLIPHKTAAVHVGCVRQCPAHAITGATWSTSMPREEIVDVEACL